ncbi:MAG TPA: nuclear transport factor 2 family protein [Solirubrobacteraceae bacterium]|nr:nuclear transport factor 2 family protein [Solirubrobacteraceae bacterium]
MAAPSPDELPRLFAQAVNAGDTGAAMELWGDDAAIVTPDGGVVGGQGAIEGAVRALIEAGTRIEISIERVFHAGAVALALGTLTMRGTDGHGRPFEQRSSSLAVYSRQDGGWRVVLDAPWGLPGG